MRRSLAVALAVAVVAAMVAYLVTQRALVTALRSIEPVDVLWLLAISVLGLLAQARQFLAAISVYEVRLPMSEATGLTAVNTMANYYVPARGGSVVRGSYMYAVHRFPVSSYAIVTVATVAVGLLVAIGVGLLASIVLALSGEEVTWRVPAIFLGVIGLLGLALVFAVLAGRLLSWSSRFANLVGELTTAVQVMARRRRCVARLAGWSVAVLAIQAMRLNLAFDSLSVGLTVAEIGLIAAFAGISFVLSITPGNLGIKEGVTVFAASLVGVDFEAALLVSLIDRGAALAVTLGVGLAFLPILTRRASRASA